MLELCLLLAEDVDIMFHVKMERLVDPSTPLSRMLEVMLVDIQRDRRQRVLVTPLRNENCATIIQVRVDTDRVKNLADLFSTNDKLLKPRHVKKTTTLGSELLKECQHYMCSRRDFPLTYYWMMWRRKRERLIYKKFYEEAELCYIGS